MSKSLRGPTVPPSPLCPSLLMPPELRKLRSEAACCARRSDNEAAWRKRSGRPSCPRARTPACSPLVWSEAASA
eukprot:13405316-Alexandrium_andersonii.AAC.1